MIGEKKKFLEKKFGKNTVEIIVIEGYTEMWTKRFVSNMTQKHDIQFTKCNVLSYSQLFS